MKGKPINPNQYRPIYIGPQSLDEITPGHYECPHCRGYMTGLIAHPTCPTCGKILNWARLHTAHMNKKKGK